MATLAASLVSALFGLGALWHVTHPAGGHAPSTTDAESVVSEVGP